MNCYNRFIIIASENIKILHFTYKYGSWRRDFYRLTLLQSGCNGIFWDMI